MLTAGFPPEHALGTVNSLLALRGAAGAVTVDLAELRLDTGHASLYKWGAAPSWLLTRGKAEKIGTATPPPGIALEATGETVEKLSLRRGEVLILLSDGLTGGEDLSELAPDWPPGELAEKILERDRDAGEDDATAAVIRLVPLSLHPS
jgi:stage II sporulation protein E